ncbi:MAG TPA: hypothetical protein VK699_00340 [Terriglobales bacterium]|jgi:hypothetical protein|nr:hypothetical protein [Terriglobales bacterium]
MATALHDHKFPRVTAPGKVVSRQSQAPAFLSNKQQNQQNPARQRAGHKSRVRGDIFAIALFALQQGMDAAGARLAERASRTVVTGLMSNGVGLQKADAPEKKRKEKGEQQ